MSKVTICIPSIPTRHELLERAIRSVARQRTEHEVQVSYAIDQDHEGAWATRNRAIENVDSEWIGFLDDDDVLLHHHVQHLLEVAEEHSAQMVWGWFHCIGGTDPFPHYRGRQYNPEQPHIVPITYLIRQDLFAQGPGFQPDTIGSWDLQDQPVIDAAYENSSGALHASSTLTWRWYHHGRNTSGLPTRW